MDMPEGAKFLFFVIPVFAVSALLLITVFNKKDDMTIDREDLEALEDVDNQEDIFGSDADDGEAGDIDFEEFNIVTVEEGSGEGAQVGDEIAVHYRGTLKDGTEFDNSYDRGEPYTFTLGIGGVIQGWDQGLIGMKEGEKRRLEIPSELGYGADGSGPIPGGAGLIFETELVSIN